MTPITLSDGSTVTYRKGHVRPWVRGNGESRELSGILPTGTYIMADYHACVALEKAMADQPAFTVESNRDFKFRQTVEMLVHLGALRTKYLGPRHTLRWIETQTFPLSYYDDPHGRYTVDHQQAAIAKLRAALPQESAA